VPEPGITHDWRVARHYGAAGRGVVLGEAMITCAWNVQGEPRRADFVVEAQQRFGVALPTTPNSITRTDAATALWLGPASWLVIARNASLFTDLEPTREALGSAGGAVFDVGASRVAWTIAGAKACSVLAKSCPLDFHPRAFPAHTCAQSLFGHINALFVNESETFTMMVARSFARNVWHALCTSAAQYGYEVKAPAPYG
jgi:sarcosine oxidase subunit gamma